MRSHRSDLHHVDEPDAGTFGGIRHQGTKPKPICEHAGCVFYATTLIRRGEIMPMLALCSSHAAQFREQMIGDPFPTQPRQRRLIGA